jgi:hypothetical protein
MPSDRYPTISGHPPWDAARRARLATYHTAGGTDWVGREPYH